MWWATNRQLLVYTMHDSQFAEIAIVYRCISFPKQQSLLWNWTRGMIVGWKLEKLISPAWKSCLRLCCPFKFIHCRCCQRNQWDDYCITKIITMNNDWDRCEIFRVFKWILYYIVFVKKLHCNKDLLQIIDIHLRVCPKLHSNKHLLQGIWNGKHKLCETYT